MIKAQKYNILIVDDENLNIMNLTHILSPDYTVYAAKNGKNAIASARKYLPDLILLDIIMPDMDGYDVISELKAFEETRNIPVIFVTGLNESGDEEKGLALGAADYLVKPFSPALVKLRVSNQIKLIEQFRTNEYDIMKYKLSNDALGVALWDMDVVSSDPVNPNNKIIFSQEVRDKLGFTDENDFPNVLKSWGDRLHPEDKQSAFDAFAAHMNDYTGMTPFDTEYRLQLKNGDYRHFHAMGTSLRDKDGVPIRVAGAMLDITDVRRLVIQKMEAEMSDRAKSAFLANMSHEIRTPMNAIWGIIEILMQEDELPERIMESLSRMRNACNLLLNIINDILDLSKIEAGKLSIKQIAYDVASVINDSLQLNLIKRGDKPIKLDVSIDENIPEELIGDEVRIKQVLNNVLSNAFKYTDYGTVTFTASFERGNDDGVLVLSVRDTGRGMTSEQLGRLFDEYSRFSGDSTRAIEGIGLGMAITRHLLELMGGEIEVESEPGKGSVFTIRIPQTVVGKAVIGSKCSGDIQQCALLSQTSYTKEINHLPIVRKQMPYGSVLVVDDVEANLYVANGLMKPYGLKISTVMRGADAIEKITSGNVYDIIFMDHMMPDMDGIETVKTIRDLGYDRTIVAMTANAIVGQSEIFLQNGFDDFISKPIDIRRLNNVLNHYIHDKHPDEASSYDTARLKHGQTEESPEPTEKIVTESFIRDAKKALAVLDEFCDIAALNHGKTKPQTAAQTGEDLRSLTVHIHGMKGGLLTVDETELSEYAQKLETAARAGDIVAILSEIPEFTEKLRGLTERLIKKSESNRQEFCGDDSDIDYLRDKL